MNRLDTGTRTRIVAALVEGNSIRATARLTGTAKGTILKLLPEIGAACLAYQQEAFVNLPCKTVQCDEIWSFVSAKEKNVPRQERGQGRGDAWTWTAICADTKLVPSWYVGSRDAVAAYCFMEDLASRLANRIQLTTDGLRTYLTAVEGAFGWHGVDYAMLVKIYGQPQDGTVRYSPPKLLSTEKTWVMGDPDEAKVSTSYVERCNLTMRMGMRRFTRLTNAFSKKLENHQHAVSLHFMHYNYCRPHTTLTKANRGIHKTPAMAAGLTDHVWKIEEIVALLTPNETSE